MKLPFRIPLLILTAFAYTLVAEGTTWEAVRNSESELKFLDALVSFTDTADTSMLAEAAWDAENLTELRQEAALSLIMDQWIRKDPLELEKQISARWAELGETTHLYYLQLALRADTRKVAKRLFDEEDPAFQYRDQLIFALIQLNPKLTANYLAQSDTSETVSEWASSLVYSWMQSSPEAALEWAIENSESVDIEQIFTSLLYSVNTEAQEKLGDLWSKLPKELRTDELRENVARRLVDSQPEAALEFIKELPEKERYSLTHLAMSRLAENKSPKAAELLRTLPQEHLPNSSTLKKVLFEWGLREPEKALEWAETIKEPQLREDAIARMNTVLGMLDPQMAIDHALRTPEGTLRRTLIRNVALLLTKADLESGLAWVDSLPESAGKKLALESITHLVDRMPVEKMLNEGMKMKQTVAVSNFVDSIFNRWCSRNIEEATAWFFSLPESEQNNSRHGNISYQLTSAQPELALNYFFSESTPTRLRKTIYSHYLRLYSKRPEMLEPLLAGIRPEEVDTLLSVGDLSNLGRVDPLTAYELAAHLSERDNKMAIGRITTSWAETDPVGLAAYLETNNLDMQYNYTRLAERLANRGYENANAWVEGLNSEEDQRYGYAGLALNLAKRSPMEALNMIQEKVPYAGSRSTQRALNEVYETIFKDWSFHDPVAARKALDAADLPDKRKSRLIRDVPELKIEP